MASLPWRLGPVRGTPVPPRGRDGVTGLRVELVGYARYDTPAAIAALNDLYTHELRLLQNLFLPSVRLRRKERVGARLRRRYDVPRTPLARVQACPEADPAAVARLLTLRAQLDPFALVRDGGADRCGLMLRAGERVGRPSPTPAKAAAP